LTDLGVDVIQPWKSGRDYCPVSLAVVCWYSAWGFCYFSFSILFWCSLPRC